MRKSIFIIASLLIAGCSIRPVVEYPDEYDFYWNLPTINHSSAHLNNYQFGSIGCRDRSFRQDTLDLPPIPEIVDQSIYSFCPTDTCFAEYAILALRCPQEKQLLNWLSNRVYTFANECPFGSHLMESVDIKKKSLNSAAEICHYYMDQMSHNYDNWQCPGDRDHDMLNEQVGLLISDCWRTGDLYTFYQIDWYEAVTGGNNPHESYWTVDSNTGKELRLDDLIKPNKKDDLSALMMHHLVNDKGEYLLNQDYGFTAAGKGVLQKASGCALIREGLIIFFYPYNLGSGADGEYKAIIPYSELGDILKRTIPFVDEPEPVDDEEIVREYKQRGGEHIIDLFGVELIGTPRRIVRELSKGPFIQVDADLDNLQTRIGEDYFCKVRVGGIPFGMNFRYGTDNEAGIVKEVYFVTSDPDDKIITGLVKTLNDYYGDPTIDDGEDGGYTWFLNHHILKARHLHLDFGGWTFYIL